MLQERHYSSLQIKLDNWLFNNDFSVSTLDIFSKIYVLAALFIYGHGERLGTSFVELVSFPDIFFNPPLSIAYLFSGFPDHSIAWVLDLLLHILFGLAFFSVRPGLAFFFIGLLSYLSHSFTFSFGKIDHNIISLLLPFMLSTGYYFKAKAPEHIGFTKALYGFLIGFAFFTASLPKIYSGEWVNVLQHSVQNFIANYSAFRDPLSEKLGINDIILNWHGLFWEALDYGILLFEFSILFASFSLRILPYFIVMAFFFHILNYIFLDIAFFGPLISYLFFVQWDKFSMLNWLAARINSLQTPPSVLFSLVAGLLAFFPNSLFTLIGSFQDPTYSQFGFVAFSILMSITFLVCNQNKVHKDLINLKKEIKNLWFA